MSRDFEDIRKISQPDVETLIWRIRQSHPFQERIFMEGGCFSFYLILASVFPSAVPYYGGEHVITWIPSPDGSGGDFYDIRGIYGGDVSHFRPLRDYSYYPTGMNRNQDEVGRDGKWGMSHHSWYLNDKDEASKEKLMKNCVTG